MPKDDRVTQHMAMKIQRGDLLPELRTMPEAYASMKTLPVNCKPYSTYGGSSSNILENALI